MTVQMGIYRHYKGQLYQVIALAEDSNQNGRVVVVYIGLELTGARMGPRMKVRTVGDFLEFVYDDSLPEVIRSSGERCRGYPRFVYLGPELTENMLPYAKKVDD